MANKKSEARRLERAAPELSVFPLPPEVEPPVSAARDLAGALACFAGYGAVDLQAFTEDDRWLDAFPDGLHQTLIDDYLMRCPHIVVQPRPFRPWLEAYTDTDNGMFDIPRFLAANPTLADAIVAIPEEAGPALAPSPALGDVDVWREARARILALEDRVHRRRATAMAMACFDLREWAGFKLTEAIVPRAVEAGLERLALRSPRVREATVFAASGDRWVLLAAPERRTIDAVIALFPGATEGDIDEPMWCANAVRTDERYPGDQMGRFGTVWSPGPSTLEVLPDDAWLLVEWVLERQVYRERAEALPGSQ